MPVRMALIGAGQRGHHAYGPFACDLESHLLATGGRAVKVDRSNHHEGHLQGELVLSCQLPTILQKWPVLGRHWREAARRQRHARGQEGKTRTPAPRCHRSSSSGKRRCGPTAAQTPLHCDRRAYLDRERTRLGSRSRQVIEGLDHPGEFFGRVVVNESDPHQTSRLQYSQPAHDFHGVIVPGPDKYSPLA